MHDDTELHLIIPGICGPLAELNGLESVAAVKKWVATLSKSNCSRSQDSIYDVLSSIIGLQCDTDFPSAALTLLASNGQVNGQANDTKKNQDYDSSSYDASRYYMHADPVHLQADSDHAILTSSTDLYITEKESEELCAMLNKHFQQDGIIFQQLNKDEWLLISPDKIVMNTTPLSQAVARNVNFILPKGKGADHWKKTLTEAQMLMHGNNVNTLRENNGELTINSLWFHGSGELVVGQSPVFEKDKVSSICSNEIMLKGLAIHINSDYLAVPLSASEYSEYLLSHRGAVNLFHLSELEHLINYTDSTIWQEKLAQLSEKWIYPLIKFARKNKIKVVLYPCNARQYRFSKYDAMKYWRKTQLDDFISAY